MLNTEMKKARQSMKKRLISLFIAFSMIVASTTPVMANSATSENDLSAESTASDDGTSTESAVDQDNLSAESTVDQDVFNAEKIVGGWQIVPHEAEKLPEEAQAAFDKAINGLVGAKYTPVALMATQVVAGTNYCILCQITPVVPNAEPTWALVYIYADLQGNAEIMNVYELYIAQHSTPK